MNDHLLGSLANAQLNAQQQAELDRLVTLVKAGQRSSGDVKTRWHEYCMASYQGLKDPRKHSLESLQTFVAEITERFGHEAWFVNPGTVMPTSMIRETLRVMYPEGAESSVEKNRCVWLIKAGQRHSETWKNDWHEFATACLAGIKDPNMHSAEQINVFIEQQQEAYCHEPWFQNPEKYVPEKPKQKNAAGRAVPGMMAPQTLVTMVKEGQRNSEAFKDQWGIFCDSYCNGIRDPTRHPMPNLIQFLQIMEECGVQYRRPNQCFVDLQDGSTAMVLQPAIL